MIELAGADPAARYRLLPPELAERAAFAEFWRQPRVSATARNFVRWRLLLDIELEFGLRSAVGRTLETTGAALANVDVSAAVLHAAAAEAVEDAGAQQVLGGLPDGQLVAWVRGVLKHLRNRGAIEHKWFDKYRRDDGNSWWVTGGRRRGEGMPGFGKGTSTPGFAVLGGGARDSDLEPVSSARGWYALWTKKVLGLPAGEAA